MSAESLTPEPVRFPLRRGQAVVLHATGLQHPRSRWFPESVFSAYAELTHLQLGPRWLRLGTRHGVFFLARRDFAQPDDAGHLVRALLERIARAPDGAAQLARMTEVEELLGRPAPLRATAIVALLCVAIALLGAALGPIVEHAGFFNAELVLNGEPWRIVTANFLHAFPAHLIVNVIGLLAFGIFVERPLGAGRTAFVLGLAALGAMTGSELAHYEYAVGASGMVAGLAGAALWMELRAPERLPAGWRIPRRFFLALIALEAATPLFVTRIAAAAHAGGFIAGAGAAAVCAGSGLQRKRLRRGVRLANGLLAGIAVLGFVGAGRLVLGGPRALGREAGLLLRLQGTSPVILNDTAWLIATAREPSPPELERALQLAERAVRETGSGDPNLLDTLAEVQYRVGLHKEAIATIDQAIELEPDEPYYREQRQRFTGERPFDDRPKPPPARPPEIRRPAPQPPALPEPREPGIKV